MEKGFSHLSLTVFEKVNISENHESNTTTNPRKEI